MKKLSASLAIAALATLALSIGLSALLGSGAARTAEALQRRSAVAQQDLLDQIGPSTRFEMSQEIEDPGQLPADGEGFELPARYTVVYVAVFGENGELVDVTSESRGTDDGVLYQSAKLRGGTVTVVDNNTGATQSFPGYSMTADDLRQRISEALRTSSEQASVRSESVTLTIAGKEVGAILLESLSPNGKRIRKSYLDAETLLPIQSETLDTATGELIERRTTTQLGVTAD